MSDQAQAMPGLGAGSETGASARHALVDRRLRHHARLGSRDRNLPAGARESPRDAPDGYWRTRKYRAGSVVGTV